MTNFFKKTWIFADMKPQLLSCINKMIFEYILAIIYTKMLQKLVNFKKHAIYLVSWRESL